MDEKIEREAKRLYEEALKNGTLKAPRLIGTVGTYSDGKLRTETMKQVTWLDYVIDARRNLRRRRVA